MNTHKIAVVKFGSSVLSAVTDIPRAVHEVYQYLRCNYKVLVIVSAIGDTTDQLVATAKSLFDDETTAPPHLEFARLLATGENMSACLFTMGLDRAGIKAKRMDPSCLTTSNSLLNAEPESLDTQLLYNLFDQYAVLVLPGFIGQSREGEITLLGRGGSDFSGIFSAWALKAATCVIYKDTDGIYTCDPKIAADTAQRYQCLSYADALKITSGVIQHKALRFAQEKNFSFSVKSLNSINDTTVSKAQSFYASIPNDQRKLKVVLFGLGTVGLGVYKHLFANQQLFEIVGIAVKNRLKHEHDCIPSHLISENIHELLERDCDVIIELMGGIEAAGSLIHQALCKGRHVITANKALLAEQGQALQTTAQQYSVTLSYSAAVAGSIPILEILQQLKNANITRPIEEITGVLNGTCNFILDKIKEGKSFNDAVTLAKTLGYAENDPTLDLNGFDAAQKTVLLSRLAFDQDPDHLDIMGIQHLSETFIRDTQKQNKVIRLVAQCRREKDKIHATIQPLTLDRDHPLAQVSSANNAIIIRSADTEHHHWYGKGAGRWPTAEAVFGDLLTLSNQHRSQKLAAMGGKNV